MIGLMEPPRIGLLEPPDRQLGLGFPKDDEVSMINLSRNKHPTAISKKHSRFTDSHKHPRHHHHLVAAHAQLFDGLQQSVEHHSVPAAGAPEMWKKPFPQSRHWVNATLTTRLPTNTTTQLVRPCCGPSSRVWAKNGTTNWHPPGPRSTRCWQPR